MDWADKLTEPERRSWEDFARHARMETFRGISSSSLVISLAPDGRPDVKFCVELGMAIMLGKPIVVVASDGRPVPGKLREIADEIIEIADIDTAGGQRELAEKMQPIMAKYAS